MTRARIIFLAVIAGPALYIGVVVGSISQSQGSVKWAGAASEPLRIHRVQSVPVCINQFQWRHRLGNCIDYRNE